MVAGIVVVFIPLMLLAGLITGIALWTSSGSGGGDMSCGRCGYAVRGLTQLNCPECGADLREAGIRPTGSPGRRMTGIVLTLGSAGLLMLGCLLSMYLWVDSGSVSSPASPTFHPSITPPQPVRTSPTITTLDDPNDAELAEPTPEPVENP